MASRFSTAFAQDLREAIKGLQAEQASQHGALSGSKEQLGFLSARLQACMASTEGMTQQQTAASMQLQVHMRKGCLPADDKTLNSRIIKEALGIHRHGSSEMWQCVLQLPCSR